MALIFKHRRKQPGEVYPLGLKIHIEAFLEGAVQEAEYEDQHANRTTLVSVLPGTHYRMTETIEANGSEATTFALTMEYRLPFGPLGRLAAKLGAEHRAADEAELVLDGVRRQAEADAAA